MNNNTKEQFVEACWQLARQQKKMVLIINLFPDVCKAFVVEDFKAKGRDFFQNEVFGSQDVTDLVIGIEMHSAMNNKISIESKIEGRPKRDFSFGHDNFLYLKLERERKEY